jgi:hypothetical protein
VERGYLRRGKRIRRREVCEWEGFVYYESRKRELKRRLINEGRCDERLSIYMRHRGWEEKKSFPVFQKNRRQKPGSGVALLRVRGYKCGSCGGREAGRVFCYCS